MVALRSGKLSDKDIFPGVLWTQEQWHAKRDQFRDELIAEGVKDPELLFATSRRMEVYQQAQASLKTRQQVMKAIYPPAVAKPPLALTDEEIEYLIQKLEGVNDPIGLDIREKLLAR